MEIRKAVEGDVPKLLPLMRELAEFEKYADDFAVTEEGLREQGFCRSPPDFSCLIAEETGELVGFLVYYLIPFTYRAKPNLIIKELYIAGRYRSKGVSKLLMKAVAREAEEADCGMIKWWVAKWNEPGIKFYQRLGAPYRQRLARIPIVEKSVSRFGRVLIANASRVRYPYSHSM
jgi:GNAT superfamily N-acetyltransferase